METLDLATLLEPIQSDRPGGADPREDFSTNALYYRLRDARNAARAAERLADTVELDAAPRPEQWVPVIRLAAELIGTQAKDLEVASWMSEALLRTHGLAGLAAGFQLMAGLVETWWDNLHPLPDDEGMRRRVASIAGLNGEGADGSLIQPLRKLPLFELPTGGTLALWQYQQSAEVATIADPARLGVAVIPFEDVRKAAHAAVAEFRRLHSDATDAVAAWRLLERCLDARAGRDAPSMRRVSDLLDEIVLISQRHAVPEVIQTAASIAEAPETSASLAATVSARIVSREDAFRVLDEVAAFFQSTEPHSPLAYTLREAVRRGRLTWPELLEEIVPDAESRAVIFNSLGIRPPPPVE